MRIMEKIKSLTGVPVAGLELKKSESGECYHHGSWLGGWKVAWTVQVVN